MIAYRQIHNVTSRTVKIQIPDEINSKRVEIIILPVDEIKENSQSLQSILLNAPTLTEEELNQFKLCEICH